MESTLLKELLGIYQQMDKYDVYLFANDEQQEPLCGIYTATALQKINRLKKRQQVA